MTLGGEFVRRRHDRGGGGGGCEAVVTHVVGGRIAGDAAVVDAQGYGFGDGLEFRLLFLRPLSHVCLFQRFLDREIG